ncbi:pilus assembly protein TadG-related protein [Aquibaculum sediminis]|uniref:pilus assembly protein TadG-related protein n=1 Tax=Aquibaculum sediminis TaxID=3231907 RepID=UPI003453CC15
MLASLRALRHNRDGGVLLYVALSMALLLGLGALGIDTGRMMLLRTQMQNAADTAAMAAAVQLDSRGGARARAEDVARNAFRAQSGLPADSADLLIEEIRFYSSLLDETPATSDADALAVEVVVEQRQLNFLFAGFLHMANGNEDGDRSTTIGARAAAAPQPFMCHAPPMMMCNPAEVDSSLDLTDPSNAGRQVVLNEPSGNKAGPGNFGMLALPDGSGGANRLEGALAAVEPEDCYSLDLTTEPGKMMGPVRRGINARFDLNSHPYPAPNVINYPADGNIDSSGILLGNGVWDPYAYWQAMHQHQGHVPPDYLTQYTRYQMYLYELGEIFARQTGSGRQTIYPFSGTPPTGFEEVIPNKPQMPQAVGATEKNRWEDSTPESTPLASNGPLRRVFRLPLINCQDQDVKGRGIYVVDEGYIEVFITQEVDSEDRILAEIIRPVTPANHPDYHANVRLAR